MWSIVLPETISMILDLSQRTTTISTERESRSLWASISSSQSSTTMEASWTRTCSTSMVSANTSIQPTLLSLILELSQSTGLFPSSLIIWIWISIVGAAVGKSKLKPKAPTVSTSSSYMLSTLNTRSQTILTNQLSSSMALFQCFPVPSPCSDSILFEAVLLNSILLVSILLTTHASKQICT